MKHLYFLFLKFYVGLQMQAKFDRNLMLENFQMLLLLKKKCRNTALCGIYLVGDENDWDCWLSLTDGLKKQLSSMLDIPSANPLIFLHIKKI